MQMTGPDPIASTGNQPQDQYFDSDNLYNMSWSTFGGMWEEWPDPGTY